MSSELVYLVFGGGLILAVVLPDLLSRWAVSAPMVLIGAGMLIGLTPLPDGFPLNPQENRATIEHVTELTVLVALMGVGLASTGLHRPQPLDRAEPPGPAIRDLVAGYAQVVGDEAVAELGVVAVQVDGGVGEVGVVEIAGTDRVGAPLVERLGREAEHPAGHRDRHPDGCVGRGQFEDQRVHDFGLTSRER